MRLSLRILLFIAMCHLACVTVVRYVFAFDDGYPITPLLGVGACFWAFVELRPPHRPPKPVIYTGQSLNSILFLVLAMISATFILGLRNEVAFSTPWCLHFATLTFFQLLLPYIASSGFGRTQNAVATVATLTLVAMLWKGSLMNRAPRSIECLNLQLDQPGNPAMTLPASNVRPGVIKPGAWKLPSRVPHNVRST